MGWAGLGWAFLILAQPSPSRKIPAHADPYSGVAPTISPKRRLAAQLPVNRRRTGADQIAPMGRIFKLFRW